MKNKSKIIINLSILWMVVLTYVSYIFNGLDFGTGIMLGLLIAQIALYIWALDKDHKGWTIDIPDNPDKTEVLKWQK